MFDMHGKVAMVTGCGSADNGCSNGKAQATLLAECGATIYGVDVCASAADNTRNVIVGAGRTCHVTVTDVTHADAAHELVSDCMARFGRIDVLVNNVGKSERGDVADTSDDIWSQQLEINLSSTFRMCRAVIPMMESNRKGSIVNVSSISGIRYTGKPQIAYGTSKAALIHFTRMAAVIHGKAGIRLNCVVPGLIDTPLVRRLAKQYAGSKGYNEFIERRNARVPVGHMGSAQDVAHATLFLSSDEARYITGTEIIVDGGITATIQ